MKNKGKSIISMILIISIACSVIMSYSEITEASTSNINYSAQYIGQTQGTLPCGC